MLNYLKTISKLFASGFLKFNKMVLFFMCVANKFYFFISFLSDF